MATSARVGYGLTFAYQSAAGPPAVFTNYPELLSATPPNEVKEVLDATHMGSPNRRREFIEALIDSGEAEAVFNYTAAGFTALNTVFNMSGAVPHKITFSDGGIAAFSAIMLEKPIDNIEIDGKMGMSATFKVSGVVTWTAGT